MSIANYIIASLVVTLTAIGVGISQGLTNQAAFKAIDIQPQAKDDIRKLALLSSTLIETAAILGVFVAILLFLQERAPVNLFYSDIAKIGIAIAMITSGFTVAIVSAWPAQQACFAVARQPFMGNWIFNFTLIVLSVIQTPLILAFIVAFLIKAQATQSASLADSLRLIGAGFAIGIGCIGPALGLAQFAKTAFIGIGKNRNAAPQLLTFTFISQAIIESPVIFAMVISLVLLLSRIPEGKDLAGYVMCAAGIATGLGTFGPGLSSGRTAAAACEQIAINPTNYTSLAHTSIFAQGVIDAAAIYVLVLSLVMIFFI